ADLAALDVRGEQVQDLEPGLQDRGPGLQLVEGRRIPGDGPALGDLQRGGRHVQGLAQDVEHVPLGHVADRHGDRCTGVGYLGAADQPVGLLHGDGADDIVADVLRNLQGQRRGLVSHGHVHMQRVVDTGKLLSREFHVDDRADDPHDAASARAAGFPALGCVLYGSGHADAHLLPAIVSARALAPPTISLISWVISAWRAVFASRVSASSRSLALSVADFIARRLAAISAAAASSSAWKILLSTYHGSSASSTCSGDGSNSQIGTGPVGASSSVSSISSGSSRRTTGRWGSMVTNSVSTMCISSTPPSSAGFSNPSSSAAVISLASACCGISENPLLSPAISRCRNRCQLMPLRPDT